MSLYPMNDGWEFAKTPLGTEYSDSLSWQPVCIPHDPLIYDTRALYDDHTGWYRRRLTAPACGRAPAAGRRTSVRFEGVYMDCKVYVNGTLAGEWKYGYTTFELDITDLLREGGNLLSVRVDYKQPNSRWYSGAGIYRNVWLRETEQTRILPDGVYVSADTSGNVTVTVETARPAAETAEGLSVRVTVGHINTPLVLTETDNFACAADESAIPAVLRRPDTKYTVNDLNLHINDPVLWDITRPALYRYDVELRKDGRLIDTATGTFGFRSVKMTPDKGFFLNGRQVKLHGCCEHHDLGALGAAVNRSAIRRRLTKLREMGVNAIRTSHNPPAVELMELADEMGFLILSEGFDMWEMRKTEYDYARFAKEWRERDVASWIRRDRNHPSLIGWSIGNEIYDTHVSEHGQEITSILKALVKQHDPRGNGFITIGSNFMNTENARRCSDILKIAGYNYSERLYDDQHLEHPDWCIYGSETSSIVQSRGIYHFPAGVPILTDDDEQCSSLGNSSPGWAARSWEACILPDRDREFCAGQFIWTGFDYIGEPTPYSTKNSYFGQFDTAGFPKDSAYVFRSAWTDSKTAPFVHIFPYWDWNEGEEIDVKVASNAPHVELFLNGNKVAEGDFDRAHCEKLTLDTRLNYTEGELLAIACDENGCEIARDVRRSFGDTAELILEPNVKSAPAGSGELFFIEISALDKDGNFVANANDRLFVEVAGAGKLIGLDNGDPTDYEQYKGTSRRLFSGRLLAIVAPDTAPGRIEVSVRTPERDGGFIGTTLVLNVSESRTENAVRFTANTHTPADCPDESKDIPVRKIELSSDERRFTPDRREIFVGVKCLPDSATYADELDYRITTVNGIDSGLAVIKERTDKGVLIECRGDGEFYLRALCKNGTDKYRVISAMKLTADGLGSALTDPYSFVKAGLYGISGGNVTIGLQHGAGIGCGGGWFGFESVDLGMAGSDTVTIPMFANSDTPVRIRIYDGTPENGELLGDFEYALKPVWLTYQPMTYKLPKILRGVHTISFASDFGYDVEGFVFERRAKETAELPAGAALNIYGDAFTVNGGEVTGIGNNVILDFGEFDFAEPPKKLYITGRSSLPLNSVNVIFADDDCEKRILAEFTRADEYTERCFDLEDISGRQTVRLAFLPGSSFDMKSIRFE